MKKTVKITLLAVSVLLCVLMILATALLMGGWSVLIKTICYCIACAGIIFSAVTFALKKDALFKSGFVIIACAFVVIAVIALISELAHLGDYATDDGKIKRLTEIIKGTGSWGISVWIAIFAVCIALAALSFKYQDKIENWLVSKFKSNPQKHPKTIKRRRTNFSFFIYSIHKKPQKFHRI